MRLDPVLAASLFCISCDRPAIDPSQSLVGARHLPSASDLSHERIEIHFGYDRDLSHQLSYELWPDNRWIVRISEVYPGERSAAQKFQLRPADAAAIRENLWRVRPDELKGVEWLVEPADCPPPPTDTSNMLSVVFVAEGPKAGPENDRIGIFVLPYVRTCNTPQAIAAREILADVFKSVPGANLRSQFRYNPPLP